MGRYRQLAEEVGTALDAFAPFVAADTPDAIEALSRARVVLVQAVNRYVAYLGGRIVAVSRHSKIGEWQRAYDAVFELRRSYSAHITRFTTAMIRDDWAAYKESCQRLMTTMRAHLQHTRALEAID